MITKPNCKRVNLKRKTFSRGKKQNFKRFKKTPQYIRDNVENKIAREKEKDVFHFSASDESDDDDLGMGIDITDLPFLDDNHADRQKELIALAQDTVRPLFNNEQEYDENKLQEALVDLRYSSFRDNQKETIKRILMGRSTLFISPTGSGKSLCYQLPALLYWRYKKYMTIVVSPLISLMEDQMSNFPSSIRAVSIHSGHNRTQRRHSISQLVNGEAQVVFISPEAIVGGILELEDLRNLPPVGFVCIDEAHCLSEWSHNFRPAYLQFFKVLREQLSIKTFLGLTATASRATSFAIARCLTINPETDVIGCTTVPENLLLSVSHESDKLRALVDLLQSPTFKIMTSIIVYCNRRDETEKVASHIRAAMQDYSSLVEVPERIKKNGATNHQDANENSSERPHMKLTWNAEAYHAGISKESRKRIQKQFIKGETRVVVATIAFGMGINKANVRAIIHYDMPSSFESYVQEIGRAGRDGKPAQCHMFLRADKTDLHYQQRNIYASAPAQSNLQQLIDLIFPTSLTSLVKTCRCQATEEEKQKLDKLNQNDPHEISSCYKTSFTDTPSESTEEDIDDYQVMFSGEVDKENQPIKYVHKSIIRKHRYCQGHEVAFDLDKASLLVDLWPESIITLVCQLQQAYPQLAIKQFTPLRSKCNLFCYKGSAQMEALAKSCPAVRDALFLHRRSALREGYKYETPTKLTFDIVTIARMIQKSTVDVIKMLKKTEWELDDKTGRFRRSQVHVRFEGNSFHMQSVGDLDAREREELVKFLHDYTRKYECIERYRVIKLYNIFKQHSISVDEMKDKIIRLDTSAKLKFAMNTYFNPMPDQMSIDEANSENMSNPHKYATEISQQKENSIRFSARAFIISHGNCFSARTIARIFQGVSTPNYPAEHWGMNKKWWRIHLDVDFLKLTSIIREEISKQDETSSKLG